MSKQQNFTRQQMNHKRGLYTRSREKKFQYLRHTGQAQNYLQQKKKIEKKIISSFPKLSIWKRFVSIIKKLFKRK